MNIEILNRQNIDASIQEAREAECSKALDHLWNKNWVKESIGKVDRNVALEIEEMAENIRTVSDEVLVIAEGITAFAIDAALAACESGENGPRVRVFSGSLSSWDYNLMMESLAGKRVSIIAVSVREESLIFNGNYAIMKEFINTNKEKNDIETRVYAVCSKNSDTLRKDVIENNFPTVWVSDDTEDMYLTNSAAVLLPLKVAGVDCEKYLEGFYECIAAPDWDLGGTLYSKVLIDFIESHRAERENSNKAAMVTFTAWQREYLPMAKLFSHIFMELGVPANYLFMPLEENVRKMMDSENLFETVFCSDEGKADLMTPIFEGCHEDGSLNMLQKDQIMKDFCNEDYNHKGFKISVEKANSYFTGTMMAFMELSLGICEFLLQE